MADKGLDPSVKPFERPRWSITSVEDNGEVHYGAGMPGSLCGVHSKTRKEVSTYKGVTCPDCLKLLRSRP